MDVKGSLRAWCQFVMVAMSPPLSNDVFEDGLSIKHRWYCTGSKAEDQIVKRMIGVRISIATSSGEVHASK
jgi:hypothetical protein